LRLGEPAAELPLIGLDDAVSDLDLHPGGPAGVVGVTHTENRSHRDFLRYSQPQALCRAIQHAALVRLGLGLGVSGFRDLDRDLLTGEAPRSSLVFLLLLGKL